jgi:hypothetical protein
MYHIRCDINSDIVTFHPFRSFQFIFQGHLSLEALGTPYYYQIFPILQPTAIARHQTCTLTTTQTLLSSTRMRYAITFNGLLEHVYKFSG